MNRRERLERKLEKRQEWAQKRRQKANGEFNKARAATEGIPLGQPILVGHHSEGRHRAALKRQDTAMRNGCESQDMADHHTSKAAGLESQLDNTIFSDDDDAIERLEEKIDGMEAKRQLNNAINKIIRKKPKEQPTDEKIGKLLDLGLSEATARKLFEPDYCGRVGIPSYVNQNLGGNIRRCKQRLEEIKRRAARAQAAEESDGGVIIEGGDWVRLTFSEKPEREILTALKSAGFRWGGGSWSGKRSDLPECVTELTD